MASVYDPLTGHWASIAEFIETTLRPDWVTGEDQYRVAAYDMYEAMYWTAPEAYQIDLRGQEGPPLLVPSGRKVVETAHRYLAPQMEIVADPVYGTPEQQEEAMLWLTDFLRRERFYSKFSSNKRHGLQRGDWAWHVFADPERPEGSRVSIFPLHPATYFPEYFNGDDITQIIAVHLAEATLDAEGKPATRKLVYRKETGTGGPSTILVSEVLCEAKEWGQPGTDMKTSIKQVLMPEEPLPAPIDQIPVYHLPNTYDPDFGWGSSEMRGIERLMNGINQAITDEELTLVLEGLGIYVTDAGAPLDPETGEVLPWRLGPARVVEVPTGSSFDRVNGVGSVTPYMDHLRYLHSQIDETVGGNDITRGTADVSVAESGIALAIRMGPLISRMLEKELIVTDVMNNMFYDLRNWFAAYEGQNFEEIRWIPRYGERLPVNKNEVFEQVVKLYTAQPVPLISGQEARRQLVAAGWDFVEATQMFSEILQEQSDFQAITADAVASRIAGEAAPETVAPELDRDDPAAIKARVDAAAALIRAGFEPAGALQLVGLDPIEHLGLVPVTVKPLETDGQPA